MDDKDVVVRYINVGESFRNKKFESFDDLRKSANKLINNARNEWVNACLVKHGILLSPHVKKTKREFIELLESNNITLTRETGKDFDYDIIKIEGKIIGKWNNQRKIHFGFRTEKMYMKVEYVIK